MANSEILRLVKRLKPDNPLSSLGNTHVCIAEIDSDEFGGTVCNTPLTLHKRNKGAGHSWITTRAVEHFARFHKGTSLSRQHVERASVIHAEKVKQQLVFSSSETASVGGKDTKITSSKSTNVKAMVPQTLERFKLTPEQKQVSSQAQWYVYSEQKVSKRTFEDKYFKKMLQVGVIYSC